MNNIEKLIEAVEISAKNAQWDDFDNAIHALKALQSSEPVGGYEIVEGKFIFYPSQEKCPNIEYEEGLLFTHPPASVPLEKYNKLLDAVGNLLEWDMSRQYIIPYKVRDPIIQAIAEAEGKEG